MCAKTLGLRMAACALVACGGMVIREPIPPPQYAGLQTPSCDHERSTRHRVGRGYWPRGHLCWHEGSGDRAVSASCRIDAKGAVECWIDSLLRVPTGVFASIDDDGVDACAISDSGTVSC